MKRFGAVVFDLYGTLVHEFPRADFYGVVRDMARELGADPDAFERAWTASAVVRQTGRYASVADNLLAICRELGIEPADGMVERAAGHRIAMYRRHFRPRPGAEETLRAVKDAGCAVALVSMCTPDTPALWRVTELARFVDVEVFSSEVGLRKPEPRIYLLAASRLGVEPAACLYVGDGAYGELTGAAGVGMRPVLIRDPREDHTMALRLEGQEWDGERIASLPEVLGLLDGGRTP